MISTVYNSEKYEKMGTPGTAKLDRVFLLVLFRHARTSHSFISGGGLICLQYRLS